MKRFRLLALVLLLAAVLCLPVSASSGRQVTDSGVWENISWTLYDDGELYISGNGAIPCVTYQWEVPWAEYKTSILSVTMAGNITELGFYVFYGCTNLKSVVIPNSVTRILSDAFNGCASLENVTIPEGTTTLGSRAFYGCTSLTSVTIPGKVNTIGERAFSDCTGLTSVTIPGKVNTIGEYAFSYCTGLTSVTISEGVIEIGKHAFYNCNGLTSITIPESVTSIGANAFYDCNLKSAEFLGNAPTLGVSVFGNWFTVDDDNFIIYYHAGKSGWTAPTWNGYNSACVEAPDEYSELDASNYNSQHVEFALNDDALTATVIGGYDGSGGGHVVIPDTVTKNGVSYEVIGIGSTAFEDNFYVKSVELGANISSVSAAAFNGCENLTEFSLSAGNNKYSVADGILYDYVKYNLYIYPVGKTQEVFQVPETVKTISPGAFAYAKGLKAVYVDENVTSIGEGAFKGCTGIETIRLPFIGGKINDSNNFEYIFRYYNSEDYNIKNVTILEGPLRGNDFNCNAGLVSDIESISLPSCGDSIPKYSFSGCESLKNLTFADIGAVMEDGIMNIPDNITSIEPGAFGNCASIREINIPAVTTSISSNAFDGCDGVMSFTVAEGNANYSSDKWGVLFSKDGTKLIEYPSSRIWPYYNVPDGVKSIYSYAFNNCKNLVNLYIPETATNISSTSVYNCPSTTLCVKLGSKAADYATSNNHPVWYIDNYTLQGIEVYALPEKTVFETGEVDFSGLYLAANYGGTRLQLDEYSLSFGSGHDGIQTVNVMAEGKTTSFEIKINDVDEAQLIVFDGVNELAYGEAAFAAMYDANGRMLGIYDACGIDGAVRIAAPAELQWSEARLYVLSSSTWVPVGVYSNHA